MGCDAGPVDGKQGRKTADAILRFLLIDNEVYPPKIQKRLGHASLKITMDTYAHFFDKHDKKMVDTLVAIQGAQKGHFF